MKNSCTGNEETIKTIPVGATFACTIHIQVVTVHACVVEAWLTRYYNAISHNNVQHHSMFIEYRCTEPTDGKLIGLPKYRIGPLLY